MEISKAFNLQIQTRLQTFNSVDGRHEMQSETSEATAALNTQLLVDG